MWRMWSTSVEEIHMIRLIYKGSVFFHIGKYKLINSILLAVMFYLKSI